MCVQLKSHFIILFAVKNNVNIFKNIYFLLLKGIKKAIWQNIKNAPFHLSWLCLIDHSEPEIK